VALAVRLTSAGLLIDLPGKCALDLASNLANGERVVHAANSRVRVFMPLAMPMRGGKVTAFAGHKPTSVPDPTLIAALRRAHQLTSRERGIPLVTTAPASPYERMIQRLAFLAPAIQRDIMTGRQPANCTLELFKKIELPLDWSEQREVLGWDVGHFA
jgi:site-specific DNA recombinase